MGAWADPEAEKLKGTKSCFAINSRFWSPVSTAKWFFPFKCAPVITVKGCKNEFVPAGSSPRLL